MQLCLAISFILKPVRRSPTTGLTRFRARWTHPSDPRIKRQKSFPNKSQANRWIRDEDHNADHGTWTDPWESRRAFAAVAAEWQASRLKAGPATRRSQNSILHRHLLPRFLTEHEVKILIDAIPGGQPRTAFVNKSRPYPADAEANDETLIEGDGRLGGRRAFVDRR